MLKSFATKIKPRTAPLNNPTALFHSSPKLLNTGTPDRLPKSQSLFSDKFGEDAFGGLKVKRLPEKTLLVGDEDLAALSNDPVFLRTIGTPWTNNGSLNDFLGSIEKEKTYYRLKTSGLFAQSNTTIKEGANKGYGKITAVDKSDIEFVTTSKPG